MVSEGRSWGPVGGTQAGRHMQKHKSVQCCTILALRRGTPPSFQVLFQRGGRGGTGRKNLKQIPH